VEKHLEPSPDVLARPHDQGTVL